MIFEEMKNKDQKEAFLAKRRAAIASNAAEVDGMEAYILTERFDKDIQRLIEGDYYFDLPKLIMLRKGQSNRKRKVFSFSLENKILLQYLTFMLMERYDNTFPKSLYSFRKDNPVGKLFKTIRNYDPHREKYNHVSPAVQKIERESHSIINIPSKITSRYSIRTAKRRVIILGFFFPASFLPPKFCPIFRIIALRRIEISLPRRLFFIKTPHLSPKATYKSFIKFWFP